jgi:hypothetical protein
MKTDRTGRMNVFFISVITMYGNNPFEWSIQGLKLCWHATTILGDYQQFTQLFMYFGEKFTESGTTACCILSNAQRIAPVRCVH